MVARVKPFAGSLASGATKGAVPPKPAVAASPAKSSTAKGGAKAAAAGASGEEAKTYTPYPVASMAQVRRTVSASCILPLGAYQLGPK